MVQMFSLIVIITEIAICFLFVWLLYTLYQLTHQEMDMPQSIVEKEIPKRAYAKLDSLTGAQIFAAIQILEANRQGLALKETHHDWITQSTALYLMGAAETIADHFQCSCEDTHEIMQFLLTRNLNIIDSRAERFIQNFVYHTVSSDDMETSESGRKAALSWITNKFTPIENSLIETIRHRGIA
jgi:hypothetical protein